MTFAGEALVKRLLQTAERFSRWGLVQTSERFSGWDLVTRL